MALNLSTLTNPATSGGILAEALTTADFLDPVPILKNLARGSQKGGDAKQTTGLNQPKALPLIDGDGYLYLSGVSGNYASLGEAVLPNNTDFDITIDFYYAGPNTLSYNVLFAQYVASDPNRFFIYIRNNRTLGIFWAGFADSSLVVTEGRHTVRFVKSGSTITVYLDGVQGNSLTHSTDITQTSTIIGNATGLSASFKGAVFSAVEANGLFNCDFTATNVRHGDTKFKCATGQVVTVNQSGNDPATIIKKPVLRFDGANSSLQGLFANNIDGGYMFAAFSVLGDGGEIYGRIFSVDNSVSAFDYTNFGFIFSLRDQTTNDLGSYYNSTFNLKNDLFDADNGDILHEVRSKSGQHLASVNGASPETNSRDTSSVDSNTFNISKSSASNGQAAIDLEYLALFPASITDDQADSVRNYINNRNNVFSLIDSQGYYFYDAQKAPAVPITTGSASWNGRIVGSDNGDSDRYLTQGTTNDAPVGDGFVVTFADNTDHLDIPSTTQAGWQIVGTSLGTFAYRVNANAVTELNLLGNLGNASYRQAGQSYGIILLPESATGADIEAARKLLIDRGAADGATASDYFAAWYQRSDLVEFKSVNMTGVTHVQSSWNSTSLESFDAPLPSVINGSQAWYNCSSLKSFSSDLPSATSVTFAWYNNTSLSDFRTTDIKTCSNFTAAWQGCSALSSFPAGAKLGTEATNVNFSNAWRESGLTSFSTPLPTGNNLIQAWYNCTSLQIFSAEITAGNLTSAWYNNTALSEFKTTDIKTCNNFTGAWQNCSSLQSFPAGAKLGTSASNVNFSSAWQSSGLTSFPSNIDLSKGTVFTHAWRQTSLTSFPANQSMINSGSFYGAWRLCTSLTSFSEGVFDSWNPSSISSGVFDFAFDGCSSMTALSVQNILTSIDTSGQFATSDGTSGGSALSNAEIEIDYNVATGSLSAATNTAVTSLKSKGWSIIVNNVTL